MRRTLVVVLATLAALLGPVSGTLAVPAGAARDGSGETLGKHTPAPATVAPEAFEMAEATASPRAFTTEGPADAPQCTGPYYLPRPED
ncbi:MAG: hypothetical protein ACJ72D_10530, partial [Marmoricola sp.]